MLSIIQNIPDVQASPLDYVLEVTQLKQKENTLWLEFGVASGKTINYISTFADKVYGFDSFLGNPETWREGFEAGVFSTNGVAPEVNANVELVTGLFQDTLVPFLQAQGKKVSLIHIDSDLYSSAKFVLDAVRDYLDVDCVIVFDEFVNYPGVENGELKAFYEFVTENTVSYDWIGMCGTLGMAAHENQRVGVTIHSAVAGPPAPAAPAAPAEAAPEAAPAEAAPAAPAEAAPAAPAEAAPAEAAPAEAAPAEAAPAEAAPAEAAPAEAAPAEAAPAEAAPAEAAPAEAAPAEAAPAAPAEAAPAEAAPAEAAPEAAP